MIEVHWALNAAEICEGPNTSKRKREAEMYDDLKGKVAIVTGAGRPNGLGQGMAKRFAREGCRVVITDVARPHVDLTYGRGTWDDLLARQREIEAIGAECLPLKCDVTLEEEVENMVDEVIEAFGRVDILVNNVGGGPPGAQGPLLEVDGANWDEGMAVNVKGTHLCSRAAARKMIERGEGGKIVSIASQAAKRPYPGIGVYCAGKAAVCHYTLVLALELAPHKINVNAVLPGTIETDLFKESGVRAAEMLGITYEVFVQNMPPIPLARLETQEDVAASVAWLCSRESEYITGECILVAGGQTIS
jgi:meso-butanediol dehydrogenase/(S,S)-butanediol dehydrogenase/diacetyl reductase